MALTATVTDILELCRLYEQLYDCLKDRGTVDALDLLEQMMGLVALNVDMATMTRNLLKGMPDKRQELEECFRQFGWSEDIEGY